MAAITRASCSPKASICRSEVGRRVEGRRRRGGGAEGPGAALRGGGGGVATAHERAPWVGGWVGGWAGGRGAGTRLLAEGRLLLVLLGLGHVGLDLADLGTHAGRGDDADGRAVGDRRAREHHVQLALDAHILGDDLELLEHGLALARERALVRLDGGRLQLDDAHVGRHLVAHADVDDVARHELRRRHVGHEHAVTQHLGGGRLHLLECVERVLGVVLLPDADDGVDDQDEHDHEGLDEGLQALVAIALEEGKHLPAGSVGLSGCSAERLPLPRHRRGARRALAWIELAGAQRRAGQHRAGS
jgi:hypothetical protein